MRISVRSIRAVRVKGKTVLVTAELNVARDRRGKIIDDSRLQAVVPTLQYLRRAGAKVVVATHLGRPNGRRVAALSTQSLVIPLSRALGSKVFWVRQSVGPSVEAAVKQLTPGNVLLLENTRFEAGDEKNSTVYARSLARLCDIFVLESFGTAHRRHASIIGVGKYRPSYAGLQFEREVQTLSNVMNSPKRPLVAVLGGSKISTKLGLILSLIPKVDALLLGGALANTILQAKGLQIGKSMTESSLLTTVRRLQLTNPKLHIPVDVVVESNRGRVHRRAVGAVEQDESIYDIGPDTVNLFSSVLRTAKTIVWNGPLGKYEDRPFDRGTKKIAQQIAQSRARTVVGGGETVDAVRSQHLESKISFLSTGGGAMLEFLEGRKLPGVELVRKK